MANESLLKRYLEICQREKLCHSAEDLGFYLGYLFEGVVLKGKKVIDIGAGPGTYGLYAAINGAAEVVCLEPEAEGSRTGFIAKFKKIAAELGLKNIKMLPLTFQQYQAEGKKYDIVLLHHSINHLNEPACIDLLDNQESQNIYRGLFGELAALTADRGKLIVTDAARRNFFHDIKLRNPFTPTIEWHKHQQPETWAALLAETGFYQPKISWTSPSQLHTLGRVFLGNKVASYFLHSHFRLVMDLEPKKGKNG